MLKSMIAGVAALTIVGSGLVVAQPGPRGDTQRYRPTAEDVAALTDARIAALRAGLKLSAEQEKHWPAIEAALRDVGKQRADRVQERQARPRDQARQRPDTIERLRRGATAMSARAATLTKLADAAEPLYKSLDDSQKHRFSVLLRAAQRSGLTGPRRWHRRADAR